MTLRRTLAIASVLLFAGVLQAAAQFPPPPGAPGQASPFPPAPGQAPGAPSGASPFPSAPGQAQPGGAHPCEAFLPLREAAEKGAAAIRAAGERKASREEVCPLFRSFTTAEAKMLKFVEANQRLCNVPADTVKQIKSNHGRTVQVRNQVCSAGPGPRGPSLSDAFGAPPVPTEAPKPGRGTFDTLTGSPLAR